MEVSSLLENGFAKRRLSLRIHARNLRGAGFE
jgi:hypothetical protein